MFEDEKHLNNFLSNQSDSSSSYSSGEREKASAIKDPKDMTQEEIKKELMGIESRMLRSLTTNTEDEFRKAQLLEYKQDE